MTESAGRARLIARLLSEYAQRTNGSSHWTSASSAQWRKEAAEALAGQEEAPQPRIAALVDRLVNDAMYECNDSPVEDEIRDWCARQRSYDDFCSGCRTNALLTEAASTITSLAAKAEEHAPAPPRWQSMESAPKDGTAFRAYAPSLIDADFNPWGSVEAVFEGDRIIGAVWNGQHDIWNTLEIHPTHWMPLPPAPRETREEPR